jgi:hypothetical protein
VKPSLPVIADINVSVTDVIDNLSGVRSHESHRSRVIPAHVLWCILLFFAGPSLCHATIILTGCGADRVILAADGLSLSPGRNPPFRESCKIVQGSDRCFFAISGVQDIKDINYDLVPRAVHACKSRGSIVQRADVFEKDNLSEVRRAWNHIRAHEPAAYALMRRSGPARISAVFAGGPPFTIAIVQYVEDSSGNMSIDNSIVDVGNFAKQTAFETVGAGENVKVYQSQHREIGFLSDEDFLRRLLLGAIQLEVEPKRIGPPIAILEINATGAKWIEKGACAEIRHTTKQQKTNGKQPSAPFRCEFCRRAATVSIRG